MEHQEVKDMEEKGQKLPEVLPILPVRDSVIFPRMVIPLMVRDEEYLKMVDQVLQTDKLLMVAMIKEADGGADRRPPQVHHVGTAGVVLKLTKTEEGTVVVVQGVSRVKIQEIISSEPFQIARITPLHDIERSGKEIEAMMTSTWGLFKQIVDLSPHLPSELVQLSRNVDQPGPLADMIVSTLNMERNKKQEILETLDVKERLRKVILFLNEELELQKMGKRIQEQVRKGIDKSQREYYLREQLKAIQKELGIDKEEPPEIQAIKEKLEKKALPEAVAQVAEKELERLSKMSPMSPEYTVSRTYLDWILDLPWLESTQDTIDIQHAKKVLDKHHYNLEKVKNRILEYLAVRKLNPEHKGPILCFVGPPGTGKTSLGRAIAEAMGRRFVRISLGGVRDEAEIRGHRRTYVGALPGRIIQGIKKAKSNNPVFMLDEVDKLGLDFRGDPSSALLEVLDPEQNYSFSDHYLELEFDLSKVMFITTANQLDPIPAPLRDRMEILELVGYTEDEKLQIATKFLIPRQISEHGLKRSQVTFRKPAIRKIIREYTREAGLRNLEREIGAICRAIAKDVAEGKSGRFVVGPKEVEKYLGKPKFAHDMAERTSVAGIAVGLAWTPTGGDILFVEATMMPGEKSLVLTGQLGDVMKESAQAALSYVRSRAGELGIAEDFYKKNDIHIHVPAGAIPKDGPSAGVTMLTALASLLTKKPVKPWLAMTGEVTLRGTVLPVGGIKEKVLAASRSGIKEIILPKENQKDLDEIPEKIRKQIKFYPVNRMEEVLEIALGLNHKKTPTKGRPNKKSKS